VSHDAEPSTDWRFEELRRLGELERRVIPHHARPDRIESVVHASGYSRWMIERLRNDRMWLR
jgi:hypothetical protein